MDSVGRCLSEYLCWVQVYLEQLLKFLYEVIECLEGVDVMLHIPLRNLSFKVQLELHDFLLISRRSQSLCAMVHDTNRAKLSYV